MQGRMYCAYLYDKRLGIRGVYENSFILDEGVMVKVSALQCWGYIHPNQTSLY